MTSVFDPLHYDSGHCGPTIALWSLGYNKRASLSHRIAHQRLMSVGYIHSDTEHLSLLSVQGQFGVIWCTSKFNDVVSTFDSNFQQSNLYC